MITLAVPIKNARLAVLANALDAADSGGVLRLYTGLRPGVGEALTTQTLLVSLLLPQPCTASLANGTLTLAPIPAALCQHSGTAVWARFTDGEGNGVADGDVGLTGSGAEVELSTLLLLAGGSVSVSVASLTE